jgi:cytochrome P450 family 6
MLAVYLISALAALTYLWIKKRFNYWNARGFQSLPTKFPSGNLEGVGQSITECEAIDKIYSEFKGKATVVGMYSFLEPVVLPIDPELYKNILVRDFSTFQNRGFYHNKEVDPLSAK